MTDTTFREAAKPQEEAKSPEPKSPDRVIDGEGATPVAFYEELEGVPYTAKYFEVEKIWDDPDIGLKDDIKVIENYFKDKVKNAEVEDSKDNYKSYIKELEKATDSKNAPAGVRIAKMAEFAKFMRRMDEIDRLKHKYTI